MTYVIRLFDFWNFFSPFLFILFFSFLFAAVIGLLLGLLAVKKLLRKRHWDGQFLAWSSQVQWQEIFVHISSSIRPITLIWVSLERSFPPVEVEYTCRWCQFWSKGMTSEVEERPRLVMAGYGRHRSQWVNAYTFSYFLLFLVFNLLHISFYYLTVPLAPRLFFWIITFLLIFIN